MPSYKRLRANLAPFEKITSLDQLKEGMVLIDKWACKRTVLLIGEKEIWLSHKYGKTSKVAGKSWPKEMFLERCPNWIWVPLEERIKMNPLWLIWSFEHGGWWKPNRQGYTQSIKEAGSYPYREAIQIVTSANAHGTINEAMLPETDAKNPKQNRP